ncbi:hypothetical protein Hypma_011255 [Hypsizygus marmoreus]|uniref:Uncharacterized protein n=1 Tax=Hypsizygus marmoreus TaxID=39966 RepID=A0A369JM74_HYPMA|nr:hypothetical protein Hypma_011255 [Hypsizygus marmoreus]
MRRTTDPPSSCSDCPHSGPLLQLHGEYGALCGVVVFRILELRVPIAVDTIVALFYTRLAESRVGWRMASPHRTSVFLLKPASSLTRNTERVIQDSAVE